MKRISRQDLLRISGRAVPVTPRTNPRARRLIVKVHPSTGEVSIIAPSVRALERARDFAKGHSDWIAQRLSQVPEPVPFEAGAVIPFRGKEHTIRRAPEERGGAWIDSGAPEPTIRVAGAEEHVARRVLDFLKREARRELTRKTWLYAEALGVKPRRITVRDTASRWGSCSSKGGISYSWRLILAPNAVLNYVAAHEVAHLKEMNHGPRFWRLVERLLADVQGPQAWLREHGPFLHRYGAEAGITAAGLFTEAD